jgi:hypothetical protein
LSLFGEKGVDLVEIKFVEFGETSRSVVSGKKGTCKERARDSVKTVAVFFFEEIEK